MSVSAGRFLRRLLTACRAGLIIEGLSIEKRNQHKGAMQQMENTETKRLSKAAIADYQARLNELRNVKRLEVAEQIKEARAFGDISENAEYDAAMDNQARIEYEIAQLEELLANVEEIDEESIDISVVSVGGRIQLERTDKGSVEEFDIVSTSETEPFGRKVLLVCSDAPVNQRLGYQEGQQVEVFYPAKLSNESPVGRAILGRKEGETVDVMAPAGMVRYRIVSIERAPETPQGRVMQEEVLFAG